MILSRMAKKCLPIRGFIVKKSATLSSVETNGTRHSQPAACRFAHSCYAYEPSRGCLPCVPINLVPNTIAKCGIRRRCPSARSCSRYQRLDAMLRPKSVMVAAPGLLAPLVRFVSNDRKRALQNWRPSGSGSSSGFGLRSRVAERFMCVSRKPRDGGGSGTPGDSQCMSDPGQGTAE